MDVEEACDCTCLRASSMIHITKNQMKMDMHGHRQVFVVIEKKLHIEDCTNIPMSNKIEQIALAIRDALEPSRTQHLRKSQSEI
jgi:hypothetical protein